MYDFLGGNADQIKQVYDVEDPEYRSMFEGNRKSLFQQQQNTPDRFRKQDHKFLPRSGLRGEYLAFLQQKHRKFEALSGGNEEGKTSVVAMVHGTTESVCWKIAQGIKE